MNRYQWRIGLIPFFIAMAMVGIHLTIQGQSQTSLHSTSNNRVESAGALAAYRRGLDQYSEGNSQDAINSLRQAIVLNPSFTEAYNSLCVVYDHLNRTDDAIDVCERATVLRSDFVPAFYNLGLVYDAANRRNEAIASLKRAIQLNPGYVQAHYHLGRIYDASGDYEEARKFLKQAISLRPGYADAYNELGFSYCSSGQFDNAIGTFRQAVILEPDQARFHSNLGTTYYLAGRYDEAIACLSRAIDLKSDFLVAHDNLGVVYLKTGQYEQAIQHFQRAIELSKASNNLQAGLYNDLASSYAHLRKYKKAATLLNKALQINPDFTVAVFNLGVVDLMRQDRPAAFRQYARLKQIDPARAQKLYACIYGSRIIQAGDSANNTRTSENLNDSNRPKPSTKRNHLTSGTPNL